MQRPMAVLVLVGLLLVGCGSEPATDDPAARTSARPGAPDRSPETTGSRSATPSAPARGGTASPRPGFDVEAWRAETIERFGPEREYGDGSKQDYVDTAYAICEADDRPAYEEDSLQQYILDTFCPNV